MWSATEIALVFFPGTIYFKTLVNAGSTGRTPVTVNGRLMRPT
jgi:hypothetical protein